jgi:CHAT domain-containing protein/Flp pilus assembly protein TadD
LLTTAFCAFGQPEVERKKLEAQATFDEAIRLRNENTFNSYKSALEKFQKAARLYEELGSQVNVGSALLGVGLINKLLGENESALRFYLQALEIFRAVGNQSLEARALNNLGLLYDDIGDKQKALEYHNLALPLRIAMQDRSGEARTLNAIGAVYADLGERQKALEFYQKSLKIRREIDEIYEQGVTLNNIGRVYDDLGDKRKALGFYEQSLILRRKSGDKNGEAITLNNIGMRLADLGKNSEALDYYQKSLEIVTSIGFELRKATVFNNISVVYLQINQPQKSLKYSTKAIAIYQKSGRNSGEATALNNIGFANLLLGNYVEALKNLHQALILSQSSQAKGLEAIVLSNLMRGYQLNKNNSAAIFYGKQSVNNYQKLRGAISGLDQTIQRIYLQSVEDTYRYLADLLIEAGRFAEAQEVLRMLKEEEFSKFARRDSTEIKTLSQRVNLTAKEKLLLEKYAKLAESVAQIGEKFQKLDAKKRLLEQSGGTLSSEENAEYQRLSAELANANAAFKLFLEKELVKEIGTENTQKIQADRALQEKLRKFGADAVILSTVVTENRYRVILTTSTVQIDAKTDIKASDLNKKIFAFREALENEKLDPKPLGKEIYDILLKPLEKALKESKAQTLVWSLDGTLRYIPLAALSPDGKSYLVEKYQNVILTPQTRDDVGDSNIVWNALGMGVSTAQSVVYPDFPDNPVKLDALPAVESELKTVIRENGANENGILNGKRFLNENFTLKNLTDSLSRQTVDGKKEFSVVHLASHFRLADNWTNSFLLIGNGKILTLEQISHAPQIDFTNVELITLSACNTADGDFTNGGEVDSLAGLIQIKNGKAVLATLWAVEDESTSKLMSNFYRFRQENPTKTKAEAIQHAQKNLLSEKSFAHPVYWSPFILIGNWR